MFKNLNLRELLNFYDYRVSSSVGHASAINAVMGEELAVALLNHYFSSFDYKVVLLDQPCTQGTNVGHRLDKWIAITSSEEKIIYQVEIKNWSSHSLNSEVVRQDGDESYMRDLRLRRWRFQFNEAERVPSQVATQKVLTKMRVPTEFTKYSHKALLCFWEPLHSSGDNSAFFEVSVNSENFKKLSVFSMSNYVSLLLKNNDFLEVELAETDQRIDWLNKLYS